MFMLNLLMLSLKNCLALEYRQRKQERKDAIPRDQQDHHTRIARPPQPLATHIPPLQISTKNKKTLKSSRGYRPGTWARIRGRKQGRIKEYISNLKANTPCRDCGKMFHPAVMEFDHITDCKSFDMSKPTYTWASTLREISKCEIVCANCHRMRTVTRSMQAKITDGKRELDSQLNFNW